MSSGKDIFINLVDDNPLLVNTKLQGSTYLTKEISYVKEVQTSNSILLVIKAWQAREKGYQLDPSIPDDEDIEIELEDGETKTEKVNFNQIVLVDRNRPRKVRGKFINKMAKGRRKDIRYELAEAAKNPFSFISHRKLLEYVQGEIDDLKERELKEHVAPFVVVFLGLHPETDRVVERATYFINSWSPFLIKVENKQGTEYDIHLSEEASKSGLIRNFILFLPSNAVATDNEGQLIF